MAWFTKPSRPGDITLLVGRRSLRNCLAKYLMGPKALTVVCIVLLLQVAEVVIYEYMSSPPSPWKHKIPPLIIFQSNPKLVTSAWST